MKKKKFFLEVNVIWDNVLEAKNEKEAIKTIKNSFLTEYNIDLINNEIKIIKKRKRKSKGEKKSDWNRG